MNRPPVASMVISVTILTFVPALLALGIYELPSLRDIRASHTADIVGVWIMTWGLIVLGILGALTLSWLAWTADAAAEALEGPSGVDGSESPLRHSSAGSTVDPQTRDSAGRKGRRDRAARTPSSTWLA